MGEQRVKVGREWFDVELRRRSEDTGGIDVTVTGEDGTVAEAWVHTPGWWWLARRKARQLAKGLVAEREGSDVVRYRLWREKADGDG